MRILLRLTINALTLLIIPQILEGFTVSNFYVAIIVAIILGLLNAVIGPILKLLAFPITLMTIGLFSFVINALFIWFVATFVDGFEVSNFIVALGAAVILWAVSFITNWLIKK